VPSFTSAAKELRAVASKWRVGNAAFRELFDVQPRQEGAIYNEVVLKDDADKIKLDAYEEINKQWTDLQARKATKEERRTLNDATYKAKDSGIEKKELRKIRRPLITAVREKRETARRAIEESGGLLGSINNAEKSSEAAKAKAMLVFYLGDYFEEERK